MQGAAAGGDVWAIAIITYIHRAVVAVNKETGADDLAAEQTVAVEGECGFFVHMPILGDGVDLAVHHFAGDDGGAAKHGGDNRKQETQYHKADKTYPNQLFKLIRETQPL